MTGQRGQRRVCNQFADIINCIQDTFLIGRVEQVVEDGARDDCQAIPVQLFRNECRVDWQIAVGAKFNSQDLTTLFRCGMLLLYRIRKKNPLLSYICF